jgi:hypothetical protein
MRRHVVVLAAAIGLCLSGCGSKEPAKTTAPTVPTTTTSQSTEAVPVPTRSEPKGIGTGNCEPAVGTGTMGVCTPQTEASKKGLTPPTAGQSLIPDVSEYNGCALYSEAIVRVYEAGTERQDTRAACHLAEVHRKHVWAATYAFLRPGHGGCDRQAQRAVEITNRLGGVVGPVVSDAEVYLPPGFVSCFNDGVRRRGYPAVTYTAPGTWAGGAFNAQVWIAAYPYRPSCFSNACPYRAHQFADNYNCRGVRGDCSINLGITAITRHPPLTPQQRRDLEARQRALRRVLLRYGCRRRVLHHESLGPKCKRWFREGDEVGQRLRRGY